MAEFAQILIRAKDDTKGAFTSAQRNLQQMGDGVERLRSRLKSSLGDVAAIATSIGAGLSVRGLAQMADEFASLQARLKLASRDVNEFNAANADLVRIAETAMAPLSETATLYTRIAASVKDLNVSQEQIAGTTEAVALALRISGASAAESSAAMLQFSQAIASGVLRGEEFNSVNEAAPRLLQALAASLNVPVGSLREMAKEGQLTRDILIDGLLRQLPTLQREAATLPKTIGAAFTDLNNKLLLTVGEFDKITGASRTLSESISKIGTTGLEALAVVGANVAFVFRGVGTEIGGIAAQLSRLAVGDFKGFSAIGRMMREDAAQARKELDEFEKRILGIGKTAASTAKAGAAASTPLALPAPSATSTRGRRSAADPLAGLLASTDIGKLKEFDKQVGLLNQRFAFGRKDADLYAQAMTKLVESTFADSFRAHADALREEAETQRMVAEHLRETEEAIRAQDQAWVDAGKALEDEMRTPLENANIEFGRLQELLDRGVISWETYTRAVLKTQDAIEQVPEKFNELDTFAKKAAENIQDAFADFLFDPFDKGMDGMLKSFGQTIQRMIADAVAADLTKWLFGDLVKGGKGSGVAGSLLSSIGDFFGFANGGIMTSAGPLPLNRYASGGIASTPQLALFGEGSRPEAYVPLPDGRNIPVKMQGGAGGGHTIHVHVNGPSAPDVRRAAAQGAREGLAMIEGARRYG